MQTKQLFPLGRLLSTPGAMRATQDAEVDLLDILSRHARLVQGALCDDDHQANLDALESGGRIFSAYLLPDDIKVWVITEAEDDAGCRVATTVLLPEEY